MIETVEPRWKGQRCIVAATGPSLTKEVAGACEYAHEVGTHKVVAVNDAYRLLPFADVLYACDAKWWDVHKGCPSFSGEKWSSHGIDPGNGQPPNDKRSAAARHGLRLVTGRQAEGFSTDPALIHYGYSSGYQAINWALHALGREGEIVLVGFDMHTKQGRHFFGDHPKPLDNSSNFESWVPKFDVAAKSLPDGLMVINATPGSALKCFPFVDLESALGLA